MASLTIINPVARRRGCATGPCLAYRRQGDNSGFDRLTTQLYVAEEAERNGRDSLYNRHTVEERQLITSTFRPHDGGGVSAEFNVVLG